MTVKANPYFVLGMNTRETILKKIRDALGESEGERMLPDYDAAILHSPAKLQGDDTWSLFCDNFSAVSGIPLVQVNDLIDHLKREGCTHGYCDPALMSSVGNALDAAGLEIETEYDRDRYDEYQFGITRAAGAIAESGSVILNDETTSDRLAALSPWIHVAVIDDVSKLQRTIPDAVTAFGDSPNIVWVTGPSKTADVEGILIEGVHGPGIQFLLKTS